MRTKVVVPYWLYCAAVFVVALVSFYAGRMS